MALLTAPKATQVIAFTTIARRPIVLSWTHHSPPTHNRQIHGILQHIRLERMKLCLCIWQPSVKKTGQVYERQSIKELVLLGVWYMWIVIIFLFLYKTWGDIQSKAYSNTHYIIRRKLKIYSTLHQIEGPKPKVHGKAIDCEQWFWPELPC